MAVAQFPWAASGRAQSIGRTEGMTKWVIDPPSGRVLGCGSCAGARPSRSGLAIADGDGRDVAQSIHPHPTLSEDARLRRRGLSGDGDRGSIIRPRSSKGGQPRSLTSGCRILRPHAGAFLRPSLRRPLPSFPPPTGLLAAGHDGPVSAQPGPLPHGSQRTQPNRRCHHDSPGYTVARTRKGQGGGRGAISPLPYLGDPAGRRPASPIAWRIRTSRAFGS